LDVYRRSSLPEKDFGGLDMEMYLTIEGLAEYLKLAEQTVRRWVLKREVPYHKIRKVIRFRVSEIEKWVDNGGICQATEGCPAASEGEADGGGLPGETETVGAGDVDGVTA
jgi:excisionase family DNA binding protein